MFCVYTHTRYKHFACENFSNTFMCETVWRAMYNVCVYVHVCAWDAWTNEINTINNGDRSQHIVTKYAPWYHHHHYHRWHYRRRHHHRHSRRRIKYKYKFKRLLLLGHKLMNVIYSGRWWYNFAIHSTFEKLLPKNNEWIWLLLLLSSSLSSSSSSSMLFQWVRNFKLD